MKDEKYVFIQDLIEKKTIGRGSFNKRSHCGGSGKKKWAAELMTNKELAKMNGELKTYRLNDPMTWKEFKALPDDIKVMYIKGIRERFNPFDKAISQMMGIDNSCLSVELKRLGLNQGGNGKRGKWDKEGFEAWARGEKPTEAYQSLPKPTEEEVTEVTEEPKAEEPIIERPKAMPMSGHLRFEGKVDDILKAVAAILGGANVNLTINWDIKDGAEV